MGKRVTAKTLVTRHVNRRDRVLLINPPVEETRYSWVRWNQPLDLLKIGSFLKSQIGCSVELLDLMKPDSEGHVHEEWLTGARRYKTIGGERYPMRRFGLEHKTFVDLLVSRRNRPKPPTQVWITSLCSYWFASVAEICRTVHQELPDAKIVLLGQYARLMPQHACERTVAHSVVTTTINLDDQPVALDLYRDMPPPFVALRLNPETAIGEIKDAVERGIVNFTFFEEDICRNDSEPLLKIVTESRGVHKHLRFHITCGLYPERMTRAAARFIADPKVFAAIHFEESCAEGKLNIEAYRQARAYLEEGGLEMPDERLSGFVWIGRPQEQLDELVLRSFQVLNELGGLILKPYTPTPGSPEEKCHLDYLESVPQENRSPHFFPLAELNNITRSDYHDLYRMAAFLNERIRDRAFDFLDGTLGARFLRESLKREVWKLEPSPLRIAN